MYLYNINKRYFKQQVYGGDYEIKYCFIKYKCIGLRFYFCFKYILFTTQVKLYLQKTTQPIFNLLNIKVIKYDTYNLLGNNDLFIYRYDNMKDIINFYYLFCVIYIYLSRYMNWSLTVLN